MLTLMCRHCGGNHWSTACTQRKSSGNVPSTRPPLALVPERDESDQDLSRWESEGGRTIA